MQSANFVCVLTSIVYIFWRCPFLSVYSLLQTQPRDTVEICFGVCSGPGRCNDNLLNSEIEY